MAKIERSGWAAGQGRALVVVTGERSNNVVYTNETGREIFVQVRVDTTGTMYCLLRVDGDKSVSYINSGLTRGYVIAVVPPGSTYELEVNTPTSISAWYEVR